MADAAATIEETEADPNLGRVLAGQYRINARLDAGGMGAVYQGVQLSVNRPVAVKLIDAKVQRSAEHVARFRREAEAMARLRHPNTVRLFDFGVTEGGQLFMVMELLVGGDLGRYLAEVHALSLPQALSIARQIAQALCEAHAQGIVHRDLKPANVYLSRVEGGDAFVKVMDFGIAGLDETDDRTQLTKTGAIVGTPAYMSPEQAQGLAVDGRADLYSLGLLLFEMLAGRAPFEATSAVSLLVAQVTFPPPPIALACPDLAEVEQVQELLDRLLAKNPDERFACANDLIAAIDALLVQLSPTSSPDMPGWLTRMEGGEALPVAGSRPPSGRHAANGGRRTRKHPGLRALLAGALVLGLSLIASKHISASPIAVPTLPTMNAAWSWTATHSAALVQRARRALAGDSRALVTIASVPSGASVRLAGAELGRTPYQLQLKGDTQVEVSLPAYAPRTVTVSPEGEPNVIVKLVPLPPFAAGAIP